MNGKFCLFLVLRIEFKATDKGANTADISREYQQNFKIGICLGTEMRISFYRRVKYCRLSYES
jgi:hypothetical protein